MVIYVMVVITCNTWCDMEGVDALLGRKILYFSSFSCILDLRIEYDCAFSVWYAFMLFSLLYVCIVGGLLSLFQCV